MRRSFVLLFAGCAVVLVAMLLSAAALNSCSPPPSERACPPSWDAQVIADVNHARGSLPAFSPDAKVNQAADARATQLAKQGAYDEHTPFVEQALLAAGYRYSAWRENVYVGPTVDQVVDGWMASAPHKANILATNVTDVGVGCVYDAAGARWWSLVMAKA